MYTLLIKSKKKQGRYLRFLFCFFLAAVLTTTWLYAEDLNFFNPTPEKSISCAELKALLDKKENLLVLDARSKHSFDGGHIVGALLPLTAQFLEEEELLKSGKRNQAPDIDASLREFTLKFEKNIPIVTYCNDHCRASSVLASKLRALGFENVRVLEEGFQTWQFKGYPATEPLSVVPKTIEFANQNPLAPCADTTNC